MPWKHRAISVGGDPEVATKLLDDIGSEGWELVSVSGGMAFFKRLVLEPAKVVEVPSSKECVGCRHFSLVGNENKKSGETPGFCQLHRWSTLGNDTCAMFESRPGK